MGEKTFRVVLRVWLGLTVVLTVGFAAGCSSMNSNSQNPPQIESKRPGALKSYNAFYIEPIEVLSIEGDYLRRIDNSETKRLAERFRAKLMRDLGQRAATLPHAASDVAFLRITITDVSTTYTLFQLRPGLVLPNALRGGASIEASFIDSVTNETLVTVHDTRQGERQGWFSGLRKWDGVETAFDDWAGLLNAALRR